MPNRSSLVATFLAGAFRRRCHWRRDFAEVHADKSVTIPVRASKRQRCRGLIEGEAKPLPMQKDDQEVWQR